MQERLKKLVLLAGLMATLNKIRIILLRKREMHFVWAFAVTAIGGSGDFL